MKEKLHRYLAYAAVAIASLVGVVFFFSSQSVKKDRSRGFPILLPGAYVGTVDFSSKGKRVSTTLYVERLREGNTLLFVIFSKGFQPQTIFPQRLSDTYSEKPERFKAIQIQMPEENLVLSGIEDRGSFKGILKSDSDSAGEWFLRRMTPEEITTVNLGANEDKILIWLRAKERLRKIKSDKSAISEELVSTAQKVKTLDSALGEKQELQFKSVDRRKDLETELSGLKRERDKNMGELQTLIDSLDLFARITKRGQAVSLERRILQRESRWYNVHWQGEEEAQELSEEESGIDQAKLETAVRRARETKSFLREKQDELLKIRELEAEIADPSSEPYSEEPVEGKPLAPNSNEEAPQEEKKQLWDRLFG